jgi:PRTRC genetic system protein C
VSVVFRESHRQTFALQIRQTVSSESARRVRGTFATIYPDIATASITGPEAVGDQLRYNFVRAIGAKG